MRTCIRPGVSPGFVLAAAAFALAVFRAGGQQSLQFSSQAYTVKESAAAATIKVVRLGGSTGEASVDFETRYMPPDAEPGIDYIATNGSLHFGPGVASRTFTVRIIQDAIHELSEQVIVKLFNPNGAELGIDNATLMITDDDTCGYALAPPSRTHGPEGSAGEFTVNVIAGCPWTVTEVPDVDWLSVFTGSGSGTSNILYSIDPNPSTAQRSATLRVGGKSFTVVQRGVPPPDLTKPTVTIMTPASGARITNLPFAVTGRASDAGGVSHVEFRVENAAGTNDLWTPAESTTNWNASVNGLLQGPNIIRVRAHDSSGNISDGTPRSVNFVIVSPLVLDIEGNGVVSGVRNEQFLDVGKTYTATARASPSRVNLFAEWDGDLATNAARFSFVMRSNLHLIAKFVPNPFIAVRGSYNGLFTNAPPVRHESSGFFTATTTDLGAFSAKVTLAGRVIPLSGKFALDGKATNTILRTGFNPLTVRLQLHFDDSADQITGTLSDGNWSATLHADRATFNARTNSPAEQGRYTLLIAGDSDPARAPHGYSRGAVSVSTAGGIVLSGTLADGSAIAQRVAMSKDRRWPFYSRLYSGGGSILGWLQFQDADDGDVNGNVTWNKPPLPASRLYTNGFALSTNASGARYTRPVSSLDFLLPYTDALVVFSGGNVATPFQNAVQINPGNKVVNLQSNPNKLSFAISTSSGLFSGAVTVPGTTRSLSFKGALHRKGGFGAGFFTGTNEGGRVVLQQAP